MRKVFRLHLQLSSSLANIQLVNRKHQKTFDAVFEKPTKASVKFSDIEKLLVTLGAEKIEGDGSRVAFELNGRRIYAHRPHPNKEAKKYQVEDFREFLISAGF